MKLLAIDTSSSACSIALQINEDVTLLHEVAPMQHAKLILPMLNELLTSTDITLANIDAIAYGCGPGSFTGIRIASSVVQALGFAVNKPIIPISTLAVIAQAAYMEHGCEHSLVALDARMGQIYWAIYKVIENESVALQGEEQLIKPDNLSISIPEGAWSGIGDAWASYKEILVKSLGFQPSNIIPDQLPNAAALLKLANIKFAQGEWVSPSAALPNYLRD